MPAKSVEEAHREAAISLISSRWGRDLAVALGARTEAHDAAIAAADQRVQDLTSIQDAPADTQESTDAFFSRVHGDLVDARTRLKTIVENPDLAKVLYPVVTETNPEKDLALIETRILTLEAVWSPAEVV